MRGKVESQKAKQEKIKNFRCASLDFESPAPQASNVVAKERKSVRREPAPSIGAELPPGCPVTGLVTGVLSRGANTNPQPRTVVALMVMKLRLQATHISGLLF